jgi:hypothetical protein
VRTSWSAWTDHDTVIRRAGGRRHYNSVRQFGALLRRRRVAELCLVHRLNFVERGTAATVARTLGVSRWTIRRDIRALLAELSAHRTCPCCGHEGLM